MVEQAITPLSLNSPRAAMAASPVSREQYLADMTALKEQLSTVKAAGNVEQAVKLAVPVQETTAKLTHQLIMSITALENQMAAVQASGAALENRVTTM